MERNSTHDDAGERPKGARSQPLVPPSPRPSPRKLPKVDSPGPSRRDLVGDKAGKSKPTSHGRPNLFIGKNLDFSHVADGNARLLNNEPLEALKLYTTNLVEHNPGNPCAFLNRSLCYLALGYPELAVTDAHRARIALDVASTATEEATKNETNTNVLLKLECFATWTKHADDKVFPWTRAPAQGYKIRRHMDDLLMVPLAALTVGSRLDPTICHSRSETRESLLNDTKLKAMYRIAYSLWKCGNGALIDAIGIIEDTKEMCHSGDMKQFNDLGNQILLDIEKLKKKEALYTRLSAIDSEKAPSGMEQKQSGITEMLETRFTRIRRHAYPWDTISNLEDKSSKQLLSQYLDKGPPEAPECVLELVETMDGESKLMLFVKRDLTAGQKPVSEYSPFHVVSVESEAYSYCDACAARMVIPIEAARHLQGLEVDAARSPSMEAEDSENSSMRDLDDIAKSPSAPAIPRTAMGHLREPAPERSPPPDLLPADSVMSRVRHSPSCAPSGKSMSSPSEHSDSAMRSDDTDVSDLSKELQLCTGCNLATTCSRACLRRSNKAYHARACDLDIDDWIRRHGTLPRENLDTPQPQFQILYQLMLLKILANAVSTGQNPLKLIWMLATESGLFEANDIDYLEGIPDRDALVQFVAFRNRQNEGKAFEIDEHALFQSVADEMYASRPKDDTIPWSYKSHVINPLTYLFRLDGESVMLVDGEISAVIDVCNFDGWVLNTVMAKIQHGMQVEKPRLHKEFDKDGALVGVMPIPDDERDEEEVWIGSLRPIAYTE